jgi:hypothetical protein
LNRAISSKDSAESHSLPAVFPWDTINGARGESSGSFVIGSEAFGAILFQIGDQLHNAFAGEYQLSHLAQNATMAGIISTDRPHIKRGTQFAPISSRG